MDEAANKYLSDNDVAQSKCNNDEGYEPRRIRDDRQRTRGGLGRWGFGSRGGDAWRRSAVAYDRLRNRGSHKSIFGQLGEVPSGQQQEIKMFTLSHLVIGQLAPGLIPCELN
jgi:hypothetical protein